MTKAEVISEITSNTGLQKRDVQLVLEQFMELVKTTMLSGENVYLRQFGTFQVKHRAAKTARNISAKTTVHVAAHNFPTFKAAKSFIQQMKGEEVTSED